MRIFITGGSGCIGHYLAEELIHNTNHELFFLVRNPAKIQFDSEARSGVTILKGDLENIAQFQELLKTIDGAILAATIWGGTQETLRINVDKTLELLDLLAPETCQQVIYFSTASILDYHHQPLPEAKELGTDYIRSKYQCYQKIKQHSIASKLSIVFPTLVLGGDQNQPYSHVSAGLPEVTNWVNIARWIKADGSFHFIHAKDIAITVNYLIHHPSRKEKTREIVLGSAKITANQLIENLCSYLNKPIYFRIPLSIALANFLIFIFRIEMAQWDRFCLQYRHFSHENPVNPETFGLETYCPSLNDVFKQHNV
ncbi:NAD-dependent epimerase/dehydratase family protein [Dactylococcopsis salina]|uniref:Nucleoside-diphosphate-sugar epimerase n=1 Tax=Dactylococcopsis salina (strain PCC 8305) TaxID=13035 RepID=K9YQK8_DACS8|nr:NAD(P)-dependent oxidoreductase [Dactylococcopsis salina]AFZ49179.1 nucleoside-diphosphate-sugar epimerase [Dactylococcopsis salina PCC 8305]